MRRSIAAFTISLILLPLLSLLCVAPALPQQTATDNFEVNGMVINAATGEPVSRALLQMQAATGKAQFTGADGTFVFKNLARGRYNLTASKPEFFSEQQLERWNAWRNSFQDVPSEKEVVLKMTPEGIIYGAVKNENGEPVEGVTVRAQRWQMGNGRKSLRNARDAATDDEGHFRLAELTPGSYHLSFVAANRGSWVTYDKLNRRKETDQGYGAQFYPGVADVESATGVKASGREITIAGAGDVQLNITMGRGVGQVTGVAKVDGNPTTSVMVLLIPETGQNLEEDYRLDQSDSDGIFALGGFRRVDIRSWPSRMGGTWNGLTGASWNRT